jgi:hypothetical protein
MEVIKHDRYSGKDLPALPRHQEGLHPLTDTHHIPNGVALLIVLEYNTLLDVEG